MPQNTPTGRDRTHHPPFVAPEYRSSILRGPKQALIPIPERLRDVSGPAFGHLAMGEHDADLTRNAVKNGEPIGERIIVAGHVRDQAGRPVPNTLVEVWQANAAGRYIHKADQHGAPIDPNFLGAGRCLTDENGRYRFVTIRPGSYPWTNTTNAWRPSHIHFSVFGASFSSRLITQMYFPGDPLLDLDPIYLATPPPARGRLVSQFSTVTTVESFALGYDFDIVLGGADQTPFEDA